jgi:manganese transport system permease protein
MLGISVISSVFSCVFGTYLSYHLDVSTGGSIVVVLTLLFVAAMVFAPKYGILAQQSRKRSNRVLDEAQGRG